LTNDGYNLKTFFYLMGGGFWGLTLIINAFTFRWMLKKRRQIKEMLTYGKRGTAKILKEISKNKLSKVLEIECGV
jgi:hypothetical protein